MIQLNPIPGTGDYAVETGPYTVLLVDDEFYDFEVLDAGRIRIENLVGNELVIVRELSEHAEPEIALRGAALREWTLGLERQVQELRDQHTDLPTEGVFGAWGSKQFHHAYPAGEDLECLTAPFGWEPQPDAVTPFPGEDNTASNVGTGVGLFHQKTDMDLEFRSADVTSPLEAAVVDDDVELVLSEDDVRLVTTLIDGFMSAADKLKLDGIEEGAEVNGTGYWEEDTFAVVRSVVVRNGVAATLTNLNLNTHDCTLLRFVFASGFTSSGTNATDAVYSNNGGGAWLSVATNQYVIGQTAATVSANEVMGRTTGGLTSITRDVVRNMLAYEPHLHFSIASPAATARVRQYRFVQQGLLRTVRVVMEGTGDVTWNLVRISTGGTATNCFTSNQTTSNTTTGDTLTTITNATVVTSGWLYLTIVSTTGAPTALHLVAVANQTSSGSW